MLLIYTTLRVKVSVVRHLTENYGYEYSFLLKLFYGTSQSSTAGKSIVGIKIIVCKINLKKILIGKVAGGFVYLFKNNAHTHTGPHLYTLLVPSYYRKNIMINHLNSGLVVQARAFMVYHRTIQNSFFNISQ